MSMIDCIIFFPLFSYLLLAFLNKKLLNFYVIIIGIMGVTFSMILTFYFSHIFMTDNKKLYIYKLWSWIHIKHFCLDFNFLYDGLTVTMLIMITCISFLILCFSSVYMKDSVDLSRFFAYMNLFIASMLLLVLADNLIFMFFGWELVGLCSYLLIGFYYSNRNNVQLAKKAFIITRISDVFLLLSIFLIYYTFGSLSFNELAFLSKNSIFFIMYHSSLQWINFFLLLGVLGKSAQFPLQTWLINAMAGPTPVSALIHAATMVTAGIYLISRTYSLFILTPEILYYIGLIGTLTILISSFSALVQTDIKRILAYSTMSQIGYMFIALSVQAWYAAIFHLVMHAIFKALLFLTASAIISSCNNEQNIFRMGGLRQKLFLEYICFLCGSSSLIAFPLISAGFYSKGLILFEVYHGHYFYFCLVGLIGTLLTSIYTCKIIFLVFHGTGKIPYVKIQNIFYKIPLIILAILSTVVSTYITLPLSNVFQQHHLLHSSRLLLEIFCSVLSISGVWIAYYIWLKNKSCIDKFNKNKFFIFFYNIFFEGFLFDRLYNMIFVRLYLKIADMLSHDPCNYIIKFFISIFIIFNKVLLITNNGYLRWYVASMIVSSTVIVLLISIFYQYYFYFL
ncbi:MAG TPA: NADH-quinone oxidoreductase subunit L [Buchnera sp. (in: enterobacteria)]|nr:NADH-quinone oxidoreductase subunit L [Buchnera sp. (in: enterobacteria)]